MSLFIVVAVAVLGYISIRNDWVCRVRIKLIDEDYDAYRRLPSYDYMLYRKPWIWDINKFQNQSQHANHN